MEIGVGGGTPPPTPISWFYMRRKQSTATLFWVLGYLADEKTPYI